MADNVSGLFVYDGSKILQPLTSVIGLPIDQVNFIACQIIILLLGFPFRNIFGAHKASATTRHIVEILIAIPILYFCFGSQTLHYFAQCALCLILTKILPMGMMEKGVFIASMGYLSLCHIYRIVYDYGGYTLDITGPMMVNTQRLSSLAFSIADGAKKEEKLSPTMKKYAVKNAPSLLEYFSYALNFHGLMSGPFVFYKDYIMFIEGKNYSQLGKKVLPSPIVEVFEKLTCITVMAGISLFLIPRFPGTFMLTDGFMAYGFLMKVAYIMTMTTLTRMRYYFAWRLGEVVNVNAGLGLQLNDQTKEEDWDISCNANILRRNGGVELCTSLKMLLDNWNITTATWLRYIVYERMHNMFLVFIVSAFWHGFYPGYYVTFLTGALFIQTARQVRRKVRPYFQSSPTLVAIYAVLTFIATRAGIAYTTFPFVLLEFWPIVRVYGSIYFWYHILVVIAFILLMFVIRTPRPKVK